MTLDGVYHSPLGAIIAVDGKPGRPWYGELASVPQCLHTGTMPMLTVQRLTDSMLVRLWSGCLLAVQRLQRARLAVGR